MVFQTEKAMEEVGDKIDAADKAAVEADCKALKELLEKVNMDEHDRCTGCRDQGWQRETDGERTEAVRQGI